jgi:hypothetical protein
MKEDNAFVFSFRGTGYGKRGSCPVQIRILNPNRVLVVLSESGDTGCGTVQENIAAIATQFRQRHLRSFDLESISWIIHTQDPEKPNEEMYQRVSLVWDGERFGIPRKMARFNRNAFMSAIGEFSRSA